MADEFKNLINFERLQQYDRKFRNYATKSELQTVDAKATTASTSAAEAVAAAQANATAIGALSEDVSDMDQEIDNFIHTADTVYATKVELSNTDAALRSTLKTDYENKTVAETKYTLKTETTQAIDSLSSSVAATYETKDNATTQRSLIEQKANKILWLISDGSTQQSLTMTNALLEAIVNQFVVKDPAGTATIISGGKIHTGSLTADMLFVDDLSAVKGNLDKARIGGLVIENGSIHSLNKTAINDPDAGLFFDSSGQFNTGDEYNFIASWYDTTEQKWKVAIRADQITLGSGDSVTTLIQNAMDAASAAQETADAILLYDHQYEVDPTTKVATFTAYLYRGGVDVKTEFDPEQFTWYYKTEDMTDKQPLLTNVVDGQNVNYGYTITANVPELIGYGGHVIGYFTPPANAQALTTNGDALTTSNDDPITVRATGDQVRVSDLSVSTTLYPTDKLMAVGAEDEHLITVGTLQNYLNANLDKQVLFNTSSAWAQQTTLVSEQNTLYVYTDHDTDSHGNTIAGIKVGDGNAYVVDLPFIDAVATEHIEDATIHITAAERAFWNGKVRCYYAGTEQLVFTTA